MADDTKMLREIEYTLRCIQWMFADEGSRGEQPQPHRFAFEAEADETEPVDRIALMRQRAAEHEAREAASTARAEFD